MDPAAAMRGVRFHVVTGKGGTGKTTVAAALALALAQRGQRVLLAEVEGRQGISQTFDVAPLGSQETSLLRTPAGGELVGLAVDARTALLEYLQLFYKLGRAAGVLERVGAVDFAATVAPGVRDVLLIGRLYEAQRRRVDGRHRGEVAPAFDAVVLDAPPTGRVGRFLGVGSQVADLARMGPIRHQADSITEMLRAPSAAVHLVTLLEEMPVQETGDAIEELTELGLRVGVVLVNEVAPSALGDLPSPELAALAGLRTGPADRIADAAEALRSVAGGAGLSVSENVALSLLEDAVDQASGACATDALRADVEAFGRPVLELPLLGDGMDAAGIRHLATLLDEALGSGIDGEAAR